MVTGVSVIGYPGHLERAWVRRSDGRIFFVAACFTKGHTDRPPRPLLRDELCCPMCFMVADDIIREEAQAA